MTNRLWPADAVTGSPSYSGRAMRQALMAPLLAGATAARPLGAISGVRPGTPDTTVSVAAMVWTIKPHAGVLDLEAALAAGPYGYAIDADVTGAVTAANATYARKDGLYVTLSDPAEADGTATPGVAITYLAGTPAASPVMPATPARSMLLARLDVPKSGSGSPTATWLAPVLAMAGGVRHYNSVGDLPAGLAPSDSGIIAVIGSGADYAEYVHDGAAWKLRGPRTMGRVVHAGTQVLAAVYQTVLTISPTMVAGPALLRATGVVANGDSGALRTATMRVTRDGTPVGESCNYYLPNVTGATVGQPISIEVEIPAETAGAHTYRLEGVASAASAVSVLGARLSATQGDLGLA